MTLRGMLMKHPTWRLLLCISTLAGAASCSGPGRDAPSDVNSPAAEAVQPKADPVDEPVAMAQSRRDEPSDTPEPVPTGKQPIEHDSRSTDAALADLKIPPDWFDSTEVHYDTSHPWGDARIEIRRLLGLRGEHVREAIKLTCLYREKGDIGDGHEYPMYLFLGGEYAWSLAAYEEFVQGLLASPESGNHIHAFLSLASNQVHFGQYQQALATIDAARGRLPEPPWRIAREADVEDGYGDVHAAMGGADEARRHYAKAADLYPKSNQPYGKHLLKRRAAKVRNKLDLLDRRELADATLRDGTYRSKALGYVGDVEVTLVIRSNKIADIQIQHEEKIEQGATTIIPARIIDRQSLDVDGITGATVTVDAILDGVFQALKQAGLE